MMTSKHPNCQCNQQRFDYFRKRYKNGTLHMFRKCPSCQKVAQNAMSQSEYDANWVSELPVSENGLIATPNLQSRAETVKSRVNSAQSRVNPAQSRANPVQSRADQIHAKLQRHIQNRTL